MSIANELLRALYVEDIIKAEGTLKPQLEGEVKAAFLDGCPDAAFGLSCTLENHHRGHVAVMMWRSRVRPEAFRSYFSSVWDHDHRYVIHAAQTRRRLASMFRYAAFEHPAGIPERLTVWRGTSKLSMREALRGYSWTTDRDIACWFAMRFADRNGSPLVLRAEVAKADVALFHDERNEREAVLLRPPVAVICGDANDWQTACDRYEAAKNESLRTMFQPVSPAP